MAQGSSTTPSAVTRVRSSLTRRDVLVGGWMGLTVLAYYHNFLFVQSTALSYAYAISSYGVGVLFARYDATVKHLLVIGTIGGVLELLADYFLVEIAGTLAYPSGYPFVLRSPAYMPFAWAILIAFMGYVGLRLADEVGRTAAYLGPAVFAFVAESGYESLASRGGGWTYTDAPLGWVGHAPLFVLVAEAAMFASVYYWVRRDSVTGGIGIGMTVIASYAGVYYLFTLLAVIT
ncbi:hypothetical protein HWV23_15100 [Natronomonas halophila]|uniref:DUF6989 domain-containing protein n=1 Tax=Natronomonas halophila TaxID=2747817 RepID=UPI0015B4D60D|nr:hypothetical protein [Natronomonas halophila]QLD86994.1 hypothetical protein HWV23_15100 [Natronomonas halophila]